MNEVKSLSIDEFLIKTGEAQIAEVLQNLQKLKIEPDAIFATGISFKTLKDYTWFIVLLMKHDVHPLDFPGPTGHCNLISKSSGCLCDASFEYFPNKNPFEFWFNIND